MDTGRQILRFSIPGALFLLHSLACYFIYRRIHGASFAEASATIEENVGAVTAVLATIPIGFVIYQAYYSNYQPVLRRWKGRYVRGDRGWEILRTLDSSQLHRLERIFGRAIEMDEPHTRVPDPGSWYLHPRQKLLHWLGVLELTPALKLLPVEQKQRQSAYEKRWYANWDVVRSTVDVAGASPESSQIKSEYALLSDIYHALGAARTAILAACSFVTVIVVSHPQRFAAHLEQSVFGLTAIAAVTTMLYLILHHARRRTWESAASSLRSSLRWLFWRHSSEFAERPPEWTDASSLSWDTSADEGADRR
ncbi:MAG TPA: hypothetical protein VFX45_03980 [Solirubrobacterales bacterium]|nr:hypothetical protein [Solirubrobacterales bacterium]